MTDTPESTPRTDVLATGAHFENEYAAYIVMLKHARQLERELAAAKAEIHRHIENMDARTVQMNVLRAELQQAKAAREGMETALMTVQAELIGVRTDDDECLRAAHACIIAALREYAIRNEQGKKDAE